MALPRRGCVAGPGAAEPGRSTALGCTRFCGKTFMNDSGSRPGSVKITSYIYLINIYIYILWSAPPSPMGHRQHILHTGASSGLDAVYRILTYIILFLLIQYSMCSGSEGEISRKKTGYSIILIGYLYFCHCHLHSPTSCPVNCLLVYENNAVFCIWPRAPTTGVPRWYSGNILECL